MNESQLLSVIDGALRRAGSVADLTDDCAYVESGARLITTDTLIEGVHFDSQLDTAEQIGAQAAVQNLSDLAASGGRPLFLVWSLCLPPSWADEAERLSALAFGFARVATEHGACVVGGNLSRIDGPLVIAVTAAGACFGPSPLTRSGARPGQAVYVSGRLGDAAAGIFDPSAATRLARHGWRPHIAEAQALALWGGVGACMDISDGLLLDATRLARTSGVTLALSRSAIPIGEAAAALGKPALDLAMTGGEDYVLLFTAEGSPPIPAYRIGEVRQADVRGPLLLDLVPTLGRGFDHFGTASTAS